MTENLKERGCPRKDSAEHEGEAEALRSFKRIWKERDSAQPEPLEEILDRRNLNGAYKRVKANNGAPEVDGMTVEESLPYELDQEFRKRGVPCIRYADDIVLLAKSSRASERLLKTDTEYTKNEFGGRIQMLSKLFPGKWTRIV